MNEETVQQVLTDFGLTKNEAEIYLFLAKHGATTSRQASILLRKDKAQTLRLLKSLQLKGLAESTLESPKRFTAASFEQVLDMFVSAKKDQAKQLENTKKDLLLYWKSVGKSKDQVVSDRFVVIEGINNIYSKIAHMLLEAKSQLLATSTVSRLLRADEQGLFDNLKSDTLSNPVNLRFLVEHSGENQISVNALVERAAKLGANIKAKNPSLGFSLSPLMMVRDNQEVLLFLNPQEELGKHQPETALWTNCKTIVETFSAVFENLWKNGVDIKEKLFASCGVPPKTFIRDHKTLTMSKKYHEIVNAAKEKITFITSAQGLIDLNRNNDCLKIAVGRGVPVRVMAPATVENMHVIQDLLKTCEVRHVPKSRVRTALIDNLHIFQFTS